jgi:hypothetical protein
LFYRVLGRFSLSAWVERVKKYHKHFQHQVHVEKNTKTNGKKISGFPRFSNHGKNVFWGVSMARGAKKQEVAKSVFQQKKLALALFGCSTKKSDVSK